MSRYPHALAAVKDALPDDLAHRVVLGLGPAAGPSRMLLERGLFPPAALTGITLHLLGNQPRRPSTGGPRAGPTAGGIWMREQITLHRPLRLGEHTETRGEIARRTARGGRRASATTSQTFDASGGLVLSSCATGLERYRRDPALADAEEGRPEAELVQPRADAAAAADNPAREALRALDPGDEITGPTTHVPLALLKAWEGERPGNPIHSDEAAAREAGLDAPIAAGSHVLAFLQEALMLALGDESLLHGACFDVRWKQPVRAGDSVTPRARVNASDAETLTFDLEVDRDDCRALVGSLVVPLGGGR